MNLRSGIRLLAVTEGTGRVAQRGDEVVYHLRGFLSRGEEIPINELPGVPMDEVRRRNPAMLDEHDGYTFLNFDCRLGRREAIAGVEYALEGMKEGGYRKVKVSPHLAYRDQGRPGRVPANAVVTFDIWLRKFTRQHGSAPPGE